MAISWKGLVYFVNQGGINYVYVTLPEGMVIPEDQIQMYEGSGPGLPNVGQIFTVDRWLAARREEGFTFTLRNF